MNFESRRRQMARIEVASWRRFALKGEALRHFDHLKSLVNSPTVRYLEG
jgi:hypothetical protein